MVVAKSSVIGITCAYPSTTSLLLDLTTKAFVHISLAVVINCEADASYFSYFKMVLQRVTVTYAASSTLQSQPDLWDQLRSAIAAQLPLRNLHWKSASRSSIRTVQELPINLVPFDSVLGEHASQIPGSWLERPLLNFYVLTCDVGSMPCTK
jgi:hypothetical protein